MSVLSNGPFSYNRFDGVNVGDSINSAYHAIYEKKAKPDFLDMDKDGNKKEPFKKAVNDKKKGCSDCEGDCECDDKKESVNEGIPSAIVSGKYGASPVTNGAGKSSSPTTSNTSKSTPIPSALKSGKYGSSVSGSGGKERTIPNSFTKEDVIGHLMDEGFANNPVSAEVLFNHMSDQWLRSIEEGFMPLPKEKMARQANKAYGKEQSAVAAGDEKEVNKQMQRRIAMKDPSGRKVALGKR